MGHAPEFREGRKGCCQESHCLAHRDPSAKSSLVGPAPGHSCQHIGAYELQPRSWEERSWFHLQESSPFVDQSKNYCENTHFCKVIFLCLCLENWLFKGKFLTVLTKINNIFYNTIISHFIGFPLLPPSIVQAPFDISEWLYAMC